MIQNILKVNTKQKYMIWNFYTILKTGGGVSSFSDKAVDNVQETSNHTKHFQKLNASVILTEIVIQMID